MGLWLRTLLLGLGFFGISAVMPGVYDFYMPLFYGEMLSSGLLVGAIMAVDNVLGLTLQPYFGALSDRTRSRYGRRVPYLLLGAPVAAAFLALVPAARGLGLWPLLACTVGLNLAMAAFRSPTVALMPDLVPPAKRSQANGIINFMGGLGAGAVLLAGGALYERNPSYPFLAVALLLLAVTAVFRLWIREPVGPTGTVEETPQALRSALGALLRARDPQTNRMLLAILLWTMAFQAASTWISTYATVELGLSVPAASKAVFYFPLTIVVLAIPCGFAGGWLGRRRSMAVGAMVMAAALLFGGLVPDVPLVAMLAVAGTGWSLVIVNAYPALVQMAGNREIGAYTGLYYIASQVGAIVSPPLLGAVKDAAGWGAFFVVAAALLLASAAAVLRVRTVDPQPVADGAEPAAL